MRARLLGRPFVLTGEIVPGTGTGRRFTFPTLNLKPDQELLPARGVYVTRTLLEGETKSRRSVTNVGMRPTFNGASLSVETHLLDFSGSVTAKRMEVRFWKRLREEKNSPTPKNSAPKSPATSPAPAASSPAYAATAPPASPPKSSRSRGVRVAPKIIGTRIQLIKSQTIHTRRSHYPIFLDMLFWREQSRFDSPSLFPQD